MSAWLLTVRQLTKKNITAVWAKNGLTSARHDVFAKYLAKKYPESYDKNVPDELIYSGGLKLTDIIPEIGITAGKMVLSPTRTYAPVIKRILDEMRSEIHGMVHCSGGAQTKIMHFVEGKHVIKDNLFPIPPLFKTIKEQSGTDWKEMYKVFNMGHRMEIYVDESNALQESLKSQKVSILTLALLEELKKPTLTN